MTLEEIFPAFALRIGCGPLTLHGLRSEDIPAVTAVAGQGIHGPDFLPFLEPWSEAPDEERVLSSARFYWSSFADFTPERWHLNLVVRWEGEVVGMQDVFARTDFRKTRALETGSWLRRASQGRGIGTLMRRVVCTFCIDHLGAEVMRSGYVEGNAASAAVSRKVGYAYNGRRRIEDPKSAGYRWETDLVLTPETLVRAAEPVSVEGLPAFRRQVGLEEAPSVRSHSS
jgi:RimJ/RimL family protein N-acetyltransferase